MSAQPPQNSPRRAVRIQRASAPRAPSAPETTVILFPVRRHVPMPAPGRSRRPPFPAATPAQISPRKTPVSGSKRARKSKFRRRRRAYVWIRPKSPVFRWQKPDFLAAKRSRKNRARIEQAWHRGKLPARRKALPGLSSRALKVRDGDCSPIL